MKAFTQVMKALSDPTRVKMVKLLQRKTLCVCELRAILGVAQPTVSKHLKVLEEAGVVISAKQGLWVNYSLSDGRESPYVSSILGNLRHWLEADAEIRATLAQLPHVNRERVCGRNALPEDAGGGESPTAEAVTV